VQTQGVSVVFIRGLRVTTDKNFGHLR